MNPVELIRKKRDGQKLSKEEIQFLVTKSASGELPDYQIAAWLMATYFQGMDSEETADLTRYMIASGKTVQFRDSRPKIDKHSTGGVGDKVSIILAPLVASLGVDCPMVSGRGLGHTGGTLDKLESIPGFKTQISLTEFANLVSKYGVAMMGQTSELAPADKVLYALRDVTGTVESIPLITASILSKKVAEGITGLVLDIKVGNGAFMKNQKDAEKLARSLVSVGKSLGLKIRAILTDMNQPLGNAAGHTLEVLECIEVLQGKGPSDLKEITVELAAHMMVLAEKSSSLSAARAMAKKNLSNGEALKKFEQMCQAQGAHSNPVKNPSTLKVSPNAKTVIANKSGKISKFNTEGLGLLLIQLGGGRKKVTDAIDFGVGVKVHAKLGNTVKKGEPLATVYYNPDFLKKEKLPIDAVVKQTLRLFTLSNGRISTNNLIKKTIHA